MPNPAVLLDARPHFSSRQRREHLASAVRRCSPPARTALTCSNAVRFWSRKGQCLAAAGTRMGGSLIFAAATPARQPKSSSRIRAGRLLLLRRASARRGGRLLFSGARSRRRSAEAGPVTSLRPTRSRALAYSISTSRKSASSLAARCRPAAATCRGAPAHQ